MASKIAFSWKNDEQWGRVETFTRVPKILADANMQRLDFEALLLDPRNWPDRKEQAVLQHILRQLAAVAFARQEVRACGNVSLNAITKETGMDSKTIMKRIASLEERNIIRHTRPDGKVQPPPYRIEVNLCFAEWRGIRQLHLRDTDERGEE